MNNRTQAVVCDDLGMSNYAMYANPKELLKVKDRADLLESFLGALYIDKVIAFISQFWVAAILSGCFVVQAQEYFGN